MRHECEKLSSPVHSMVYVTGSGDTIPPGRSKVTLLSHQRKKRILDGGR